MKHKKAKASSFKLNKEWAKSVLRRMGVYEKKGCKVSPIDFRQN